MKKILNKLTEKDLKTAIKALSGTYKFRPYLISKEVAKGLKIKEGSCWKVFDNPQLQPRP